MNSGNKQTEIGLIPEDWQTSNLGSLVEASAPIRYGIVQIGPDTYNGVPIVPIKHLKEISRGLLHRASTSIERRYAGSRIRHNDILLSVKGTIGQVGLVPKGFSGNIAREIARIRIKIGIDPQFVAYYLEGSHTQERIQRAVVGTTRQEFSISAVRNFAIALPPALEQRAIAEALSDVDTLLDALDRLIAKKRDLKQAAMQQLLTGQTRLPGLGGKWEVKRLGNIAEIVMGQSPSSLNYNSTGYGLPLIQGNADISDRKAIKRIFTTQVTKRGRAGDILMSVRAPVGEVSRTMFDVCLGRGVCAVRFPNEFLYHYLILLESSWVKRSKGSTFDSVNSTDVQAVEINLPEDPAEQTAIATVLSDMDTELDGLLERRIKTATLKQGMMQELLTGRTRLV